MNLPTTHRKSNPETIHVDRIIALVRHLDSVSSDILCVFLNSIARISLERKNILQSNQVRQKGQKLLTKAFCSI